MNEIGDAPSNDTDAPGFAAGTLIRTVRGEVAVEALAVGDLVVTEAGAAHPIRRIDRRTIARHGRADLQPVRIAKDAFGEGRPTRDLHLAPAQAICVDVLGEVLISASALVNGSTVAPVHMGLDGNLDLDAATYWHVALDRHDILVAEGLRVESWIGHGARPVADAADEPAAAVCPGPARPVLASGPLMDALRQRLTARARHLGWHLEGDAWAGLHVLADGRIIRPDRDALTARFVVPAETRTLHLVSASAVPAHVAPGTQDGRRLGVAIRALGIDDGLTGRRDVALDGPELTDGFHASEAGAEGRRWRWTDGRGRLCASLWQGCRSEFFLRVDLARPALPRWVGPDEPPSRRVPSHGARLDAPSSHTPMPAASEDAHDGRKPPSRADAIAREDDRIAASGPARRFSHGTRPVIRWIKGDGLDDPVTRAAIGQATRLFGDRVDYCLCTDRIGAERVRSLLEWATRPVEWWPLTPADNPVLAGRLANAGCPPEHFGYWWKWFPERVRRNAPEWILDGDMVITGMPTWFEAWAAGADGCRMTQDDRWPLEDLYGDYIDWVDARKRFYSGLISLPPGLDYMRDIEDVLAAKPLAPGHDGRRDKCEQGVLAAAFQRIGASPIPLHEFPFGRAFEDRLDFGLQGDRGRAWGYHFGNAFRGRNGHFDRLAEEGVVFSQPRRPGVVERFSWLGGHGQWGTPGWTMADGGASIVIEAAMPFAGRNVLEIGTSRGRLSAMLATIGCRVTTVDRHDRGAACNLDGLNVRVVVDDALSYLDACSEVFDLIVVDLHGNATEYWQKLSSLLQLRLAARGTIIVNNAKLYDIPEWYEETGVRWFLDNLGSAWKIAHHPTPPPGIAIVTHD